MDAEELFCWQNGLSDHLDGAVLAKKISLEFIPENNVNRGK